MGPKAHLEQKRRRKRPEITPAAPAKVRNREDGMISDQPLQRLNI